MSINLDIYDFNIILACFWLNDEGKWEGAIRDNNYNTVDAKIIRSDKVVLIINTTKDNQ
ncbi:MAG: hypothetical protein GX790_07505 [Syntrophomonadaceae bacterium]|nr:hypothetical protein [Syntrophomonadaceae bacterium]